MDYTVPHPRPIDDEYLLQIGTGVQPEETPSVLDAFIASVGIFEVIEGARKINYGFSTHSLRLPELTEVLQLNQKLDQIENELPAHLKRSIDGQAYTPRDGVLKLQVEAVKIRYICSFIL